MIFSQDLVSRHHEILHFGGKSMGKRFMVVNRASRERNRRIGQLREKAERERERESRADGGLKERAGCSLWRGI